MNNKFKKQVINFILTAINILVGINFFILIFVSSAKHSPGLGGIGEGILLSYLSISLFVLLIHSFFVSIVAKEFIKNILHLLVIGVLSILIFTSYNFYLVYQNEKQIETSREHDKKIEKYFLEIKQKIHKREDTISLMEKFNKEVSLTSLVDIEDLLTINFLSAFYNRANETLIKENINKAFDVKLKDAGGLEDLVKKERDYYIDLSFDKALKETKKLRGDELDENICFIYKKYKIRKYYDKSILDCQKYKN